MNREALRNLEKEENSRVRGIVNLARTLDCDYKEAEKLINEMAKEFKNPSNLQKKFEQVLEKKSMKEVATC